MDKQRYDFEKAREELDFWLNFCDWWLEKHGEPLEPRITEALQTAVTRVSEAYREEGDSLPDNVIHFVNAICKEGGDN